MLFFPFYTWKQVFPFFFFFPARIKCFSSSKTFLILRRWDTQPWRAWPRTWRSCWCGTRSCCWPTWGQTLWDTLGPVSVATGLSWPLGSWKQKYSKLQIPGNWQGVHTDVLFSTLFACGCYWASIWECIVLLSMEKDSGRLNVHLWKELGSVLLYIPKLILQLSCRCIYISCIPKLFSVIFG